MALLLALPLSAAAGVPYDTYTYSAKGEVSLTAHAYVPGEILSGAEGAGTLSNPGDVFVDSRQYLYIADTGHNRVVVLDKDNRLVRVVDSYETAGGRVSFSEPGGLFVAENGTLYVADSGNGRIVALSEEGETLRVLSKPDSDLLGSEYPFRPLSVAADRFGRVYAVTANVTLGILVYDAKGGFEGFLGAQRVVYNLQDFLWKRFMTEEQKNRMTQFVPTEYSRLEIDPDGFVYAVSTGYTPEDIDEAVRSGGKDGQVAPIRKLNPSGYDILQRKGYTAPLGDVDYESDSDGQPLVSSIVDVALGPAGTYTLLDARRGRLFTYNQQGDLLFAFGGKSAQTGNSQNPVAVAYRGDDLLVLDSVRGCVTAYTRTEYGSMMIRTQELFRTFQYEEAAALWEQIIEKNPNLDVAYDQVGQTLLRQKDYTEAMRYFRASGNRSLYSEAWEGQRSVQMRVWFIPVLAAVLALLFLLYAGIRGIRRFNARPAAAGKKKYLHHAAYALHVMLHPFEGFWDIKHEGRGSARVAALWYLLAFASDWTRLWVSSFIFQTGSSENAVLNVAFQTAGSALLFVLANWCLTSLMNGEGTLKDVFTNTGYALLPLIVFNFLSAPLSYMLIQDEGMYLTLLHSLGVIWTLLLIFIGILVAQQYTFLKNAATCALSVAGMAILIFVALLCITMYTQIVQFVQVLFFELFKR